MSDSGLQPPRQDAESGPDRAREPDVHLSTDDVFGLLSNHRRRFALHHLKQNGEHADLGELAERVAAWENGTAVEEVSSAERKRVYTSLQQFHLPKLDDKQVVEFDERAGEVELTEHADDLDVYLEVIESDDVPWSQYYLGLTAVNAILVAGAVVDLSPLTLVPDIGWAVFVLTTFALSAALHTYYGLSEMRLGESGDPPGTLQRRTENGAGSDGAD